MIIKQNKMYRTGVYVYMRMQQLGKSCIPTCNWYLVVYQQYILIISYNLTVSIHSISFHKFASMKSFGIVFESFSKLRCNYFIHGVILCLMPVGGLFQYHIPIGFSIRSEFAAHELLTVKENENALLPAIFINCKNLHD